VGVAVVGEMRCHRGALLGRRGRVCRRVQVIATAAFAVLVRQRGRALHAGEEHRQADHNNQAGVATASGHAQVYPACGSWVLTIREIAMGYAGF